MSSSDGAGALVVPGGGVVPAGSLASCAKAGLAKLMPAIIVEARSVSLNLNFDICVPLVFNKVHRAQFRPPPIRELFMSRV